MKFNSVALDNATVYINFKYCFGWSYGGKPQRWIILQFNLFVLKESHHDLFVEALLIQH